MVNQTWVDFASIPNDATTQGRITAYAWDTNGVGTFLVDLNPVGGVTAQFNDLGIDADETAGDDNYSAWITVANDTMPGVG